MNALASANQQDIILVVVNDSEYGGSGGSFAVASTNSFAVELVLHETGHSFGSLADEYDDPLPTIGSDCASSTSLKEPNVSALVSLNALKWKHWIDDTDIAIPTPLDDPSGITPGLYAGSKYCNDLYRPTPNSKMRGLGRAFDAINEEALVLKIYEFVNAIESSSPSSDVLAVNDSAITTFSVDTLQPTNHSLLVNWYINNVLQASGSIFSSLMLAEGDQVLRADVVDATSKVRKDNNSRLISSRTWNVTNTTDVSAAPAFANNVVTLPYVRLEQDQSLYQIEFTVTSTDPVQLTLTNAQQRNSSLQPSEPAVFDHQSQLTITRLNVDGVNYRLVLQHQPQLAGIVFQLLSAEIL